MTYVLNITYIDGILPKGPYPPCLHMADRALLAGYPRYIHVLTIVNKMHFKILPAKCSPFCSVINWTKLNITVMSHKRHCLSNHWHMGCLFKSLFRPTTQKTSKLPIGEGNSLMFSGFCSMDSPHKRTVLWKVFPCYGIIMKKHPLFPRTHPYSRYAPPPDPGRCP